MAAERDLAAIMQIERESFTAPRWSEDAYRSMLFAGRGAIWAFVGVAEMNGAVAGFVAGRVLEGVEAHLESIATAVRFQRQGIARALVEWMLAEVDAVPCVLEVRESNAAAIGLYGGMGFLEAGRRKRYYVNPVEDALVLVRDADGKLRQD